MSNIHDDAFKGTLTAELLNGYLSNDSSIIDSRGGPKSLTPLAAATSRGHLEVVRLLLENAIRHADPNALSNNNRTPLFFATSRSPVHNRSAIVQLLLDNRADVDLCFVDDNYNTPLMNAIFQLRDKEVLHQLVDCGASLTKKNAQGDTAFTLAKMRGMEADLQSRNERISNRAEIISALVTLVLLILAYFNNDMIKDVMDGVVSELYGISGVWDQTIVDDMHPKRNPIKIVKGKTFGEDTKPEPKSGEVVREKTSDEAVDPKPKSKDLVEGESSHRAPGAPFTASSFLPSNLRAMIPGRKSFENAGDTTIGKSTKPESRSGTVVKDSSLATVVDPKPKSKNLVEGESSRSAPFTASSLLPSNLRAMIPRHNSVENAGDTTIGKHTSRSGTVVEDSSMATAVDPKPNFKDLVEGESIRRALDAPFTASSLLTSNLLAMIPGRKSVENAGDTTIGKNTHSEPKPGKVVEEDSIAKAVDPKPKDPVEGESSRRAPDAPFTVSTLLPSNIRAMISGHKSVEISGNATIGKNTGPKSQSATVIKDDSIAKDIPNRISMEELQADLTTYVKDTGLEKFFAPGDRFLQDLAKNAAALKDDPLGTPDNIKRLTCLSLYRPVIYCDDSYSMSQYRRYQSQQELVTRIAAIATKIVPDNLGVELCFINAKDSSYMSAAEINKAMVSVTPDGHTQIGTNLRNKILKPLVYDVLADASKRLQRPLLVCAITDGCPTSEDPSLFKRNIVECTKELNKLGYEPNAVTFCISQIGNDIAAAAFLDGLRGDTEIQDVLYCTTDRLDKVYEELKGNENRLEEWLLKTLTSPIMNRNVG